MNINKIKKILKQREPFLMIDKVLKLNDIECVASKVFEIDEYFFKGHFPDKPIVPGVILVEALAQTASIIVLSKEKDKNALISGIEKLKFKKIVEPNEEVNLKAKIKNKIENFYILQVEAKVKSKVVVTGEIMLTIV